MTAAMMIIAFSQIFWEAGMGKALIQRQTDIEAAANAAFWINTALGLLIAVLLYLFAQPIAQTFFQDDRVTAVLQVMTLQVLLGALASVQTALLQKEMGFKKLFWVRFATVSLPGLASVPLAWYGWGYWALVVGTLVGQLVQAVMLWCISNWRPNTKCNRLVFKEIFVFGAWVSVSGLLAWFYLWADSLVLGYCLGSHELGLYRTGNMAILIVFSMLSAPLTPVVYSWMSKKEKKQIPDVLKSIVNIMAIIFIPISILISGQSDWISNLVFGEQWIGVESVLAVMSLSHGLSYLLIVNAEAYRAVNKPQYETYPMLLGVIVYLPVYMLSANLGLQVFLIARLISMLTFGYIMHVVLARLCLRIEIWYFLKYAIIFAAAILTLFAAHFGQIAVNMNLISTVVSVVSFFIILTLNKSFYIDFYHRHVKKNSIALR